MAVAVLQEQLHKLIADMRADGLLGSLFDVLQPRLHSGYFLQLLTLFCQETERIIKEVAETLEQPVVDCDNLMYNVYLLQEYCTSVAAERVTQACLNLIQACEDFHRESVYTRRAKQARLNLNLTHTCEGNRKERCMEALEMFSEEFCCTKFKFKMMLQVPMEFDLHEIPVYCTLGNLE